MGPLRRPLSWVGGEPIDENGRSFRTRGLRARRPLSWIGVESCDEGSGASRNVGPPDRTSAAGRPVSEYHPVTPGYFNAFPNSSASHLPEDLPPRCESAPPGASPVSSGDQTIGPAEEGQEALPAYTCSLKAESVFQRKMEMNSPFDQAEGRSWGKVFVVLKGTMLSIHRVKNPGFFGKLDHDYKGTPDRPLGTTAGSLIRSYTLQNAEVGIAVDYQKRDFVPRAVFLRLVGQGTAAERELFQKTKPFVIRVRVEADQFLLSCSMVQTFLYWLECLNAAIDLAPPLDERCLPRQRTIPIRRRRRTQVQTGTGTDRSTEQVRRLLWGGPPSTPARNRPDRETNEVGLAVSGRANGEPDVQRPSSSMQVVVSGLRDVFRSQSPGEKSPEKSKWRWSIGSIASVSTRAAGVKRAVLRESNSIASLRAGVTRAVLRESNSIASLRAGVTRAVIREQNSIASLRAGMTAAVLREQSSIASLRAGMTGALLREQNSIASLRAVVEMGWPTPRWGRSAAQQMVDAYDGVPEMPAHRLTAANHMALQNSNGEGRLVRPSSSEGKWCPSHNWTYARHVRYARRCMTNLWSNAPRQSDIIVKDGKRWKIRWDLGELVLYDPEKLPGYDDAEERGEAVEGPEPRALLCF